MGADYHAYAVIGMKLDKNTLLSKEQVRNCRCSVTGNYKFCPECGKPFFREETVSKLPDDLGELNIATSTDEHEMVIGISTKSIAIGEGTPETAKLKNVSVEEVKTQLKKLLEPLELWKEEQFGIWCVGYCSY